MTEEFGRYDGGGGGNRTPDNQEIPEQPRGDEPHPPRYGVGTRRAVTHQQIYRRSALGGTKNTTMCGRMAAGDDMNIADVGELPTCKLCLRKLQTGQP